MGHQKFPIHQTVTGTFQPVRVILIWKIFTVEGTTALLSKEASLQEGFQQQGHVLQFPLSKEVFQGGRVNTFNLLF